MNTTHSLIAAYARRSDQNSSVWYQGHLFTFLAESQDTEGQFTLLDIVMRQGLEPPPHTHAREDEAWYILDGEMIFITGDQQIHAKRGDFVFQPRGVLHGFTLATPQSHALALLTPAGLEVGFRALSEPAQSLTLPPVAQMLKVFGDLGVVFAPPPAS